MALESIGYKIQRQSRNKPYYPYLMAETFSVAHKQEPEKQELFPLPLLQRLSNGPQSRDVKRSYSHQHANLLCKSAVIFTLIASTWNYRMPQFLVVCRKNQEKVLRHGVDIVIATPGRLLDLLNQGILRLNKVEHFVLDEADRMLDMGFIHDIRKIISCLPEKRQTLFFSATATRKSFSFPLPYWRTGSHFSISGFFRNLPDWTKYLLCCKGKQAVTFKMYWIQEMLNMPWYLRTKEVQTASLKN